MKNWLRPTKKKTVLSVQTESVHSHPGVIFQLDDEANIISHRGALSAEFPLAPCHFSDLLTAPLLDDKPEQWQGQSLRFSLKTKNKGLLHMHGCVNKMDVGWKLILIDNTRAFNQEKEQAFRFKLLESAIYGAQKIINCPPNALHDTLSDCLYELIQMLRIPNLAVFVKNNERRWIPYQQTRLANAGQFAPENRVLSDYLDSLDEGKPVRLAEDITGNGLAHCVAIPYQGRQQTDAWLLFAGPSTFGNAQCLSNKDWMSITSTLLSAVAIKRQEKHRQREKMRNRHMSQMQGVFWWEFDPDTAMFHFPEQMHSKIGVPAFCSDTEFYRLISPADVDEFQDRLSDACTRDTPFQQNIRIITEGELRWFQLSFTPQPREKNQPLLGSLLDIDRMQRHEQQAQSADERIRSLIADAPAIIYFQEYQDGALKSVYFSDSLSTLMGWEPEQFKNDPLPSYIHPDDKEIFHGRTRKLLKEGIASCNYRVVDAEGNYHWLMDEAKLLYDQWGQPKEVVGLYIDVTDATIISEKLHKSEERYRILVEDSPAIICRYNPAFELTFANRLFLSYLSIDSLSDTPVNLTEFLSEEQLSVFNNRMASLSPQSPIASAEICLHLPNREPIWVLWAERGLFDEQGRLYEIQAVGRDNTDVYKARLEMYQSAKMAIIGEMATTLAHEMNQPLNVMRISLTNLLRKINTNEYDGDYVRSKLNRIEEQIIRSAKIIEHLRFFGRRSALEMTPFDPQHAIDGALSLTRDTLLKNGIDIHIASKPAPLLMGHQDQLEQVLINLLVNAKDAITQRKEMEPDLQGRISMDTYTSGDELIIQVKDNGGGIPPHYLEQIFESFFTTKPPGKGTGLGLAVSFGIIQQMKGVLIAENAEDGALFTMKIPFKKCDNNINIRKEESLL
ncbi:PAS domain-containing protein [Zobellella sp. DQSA1]|uniref:PAS domain-containing sensor histidine kinase n=1 Tax=Zobellella sp. DQSA1 TaxID=3342386 RepID=UPI0035BF3815